MYIMTARRVREPFVRPSLWPGITSAVAVPGTVGMTRVTGLWKRLRALVRHRRVQMALSIRMTIAALAALMLAQLLELPLPLWAVLTAVIVTQMSVGRSLKATFDYLVGTLAARFMAAPSACSFPFRMKWRCFRGLALGVAPLGLLAAINPRLSVAPITAIIVLLVPTMTHATALSSAVDRMIEVALGGFTGFVVSFLLLPANAHPLVAAAAARTLDQMSAGFGRVTRRPDEASRHRYAAPHPGRHWSGFGAIERGRRRSGARTLGGSSGRARHRAAVAYAVAAAPRPRDDR